MGKIVLGDSRDPKSYPDQPFHLTVTSPPYFVGKKYEEDYSYEEYLDLLKDVFSNVADNTVEGGKIAINIADIAAFSKVTGRIEEGIEVSRFIAEWLREKDCYLLARYIWHKDDPWVNSQQVCYHDGVPATYVRALPNWEYIWVYYKGDSPKRADLPVLNEGNPDSERVYSVTDALSKEDWKKWVSAVWYMRSVQANNDHEAKFPEEFARRLILLYSVRGDTVFDPFMGCYDDQTEVLTYDGWKFFKDLTFGDALLTRTTQGLLEYHKPSALQRYRYDGEMLKIRSRSTDLLVTPNHNMYVKTHADFCAGRGPRFIEAQDLTMQYYRIPCGGTFESTIVIPREIMYLIGLYVSEGYFQKERQKRSNNLIICQNQGPKWDEMIRNLPGLEIHKRSPRKFRVRLDEFWGNFIKENCGSGKYHKFLSPTILNSTHLDALFEGMIIGDGSVNGNHVMYYTSSERLKDSFQELCVKLGYDSTVVQERKDTRIANLRGREVSPTCRNYEISVRKSAHKAIHPSRHISREMYNGHVYCATVTNHTMYVRRNGLTSWCGNSGTTAVAAHNVGREFAGIERDPKYHALATENVEKAINSNMIEEAYVSPDRYKQNKLF